MCCTCVYNGGNEIREYELGGIMQQSWRRRKMCVKFHIEILKVRFSCRSMDNINADLTESYCYVLC